jgi:tRNA-dihydrouridine synthase
MTCPSSPHSKPATSPTPTALAPLAGVTASWFRRVAWSCCSSLGTSRARSYDYGQK